MGLSYRVYFWMFTPSVGDRTFLRWIRMKVEMTVLTSQSRSNAYVGGVCE